MADEDKEKKIIIDEDWKVKAQREKEELKKQQEAAQPEAPELPPADLPGLISLLATQAFFALGLIRSEADKNKEIQPDLLMARYHIDMLAVLQEKCRGNMTSDEEQLLESTLNQLRMAFVHMSK